MRYRILLGWWITTATWSLAHWWQTPPDTSLNLPVSAWERLARPYGAKNAEQAADVVSIVALPGSLILVSVVTWLVLFSYRHFLRDQVLKR